MASKPTAPEAERPLLDAEGRAQAKRWLENWKRVGPILEQERWDRVKALTDADAARDALRLFELWQPDWPTDNGEELLLHQRVFARARRG
jgi:hypothetical protein